MDTNDKIHVELLKRVKIFSETYVSNKSPRNRKNSISKYHKKHSNEKTKQHRLSYDLKNIKKMKVNDNINSSKLSNHYNYKNRQLTNNFDEKNEFYKYNRYKSQDKPIKINLVNQKFKIADDFNEKNSNQFLKEKDECLKKINLTDEIDEEEFIPFYVINEKESMLSSINKNECNYKDDSLKFLSKLVEDLK